MKARNKFIFASLLIIFFLLVFSGCMLRNTPPDVTQIEEQFNIGYNDINTITNFLVNDSHKTIYIYDADGEMLADIEWKKIKDQSVVDALKNFEDTYEFISISKEGNTIAFMMWKTFQEIDCGVAYSISGYAPPKVIYCTELVPLSEAGWYYYVADYNEWRNGKRPQVTMPTTEQ